MAQLDIFVYICLSLNKKMFGSRFTNLQTLKSKYLLVLIVNIVMKINTKYVSVTLHKKNKQKKL